MLTFVITNSAGDPSQTGIGFTDTLPAGLQANLTGGSGSCGENISLSNNGRTITISGAQLPISFFNHTHTCFVSIPVSATGACGNYSNNPNNFSGVSNLDVSQVNASLTVAGCANAPPSLTKTFSPPIMPSVGSSTLLLTITNSSGDPGQNGIAFTDLLPAGLAVANVAQNSCAGSVNLSPDHQAILFSGQLAPGQHTCQIALEIKGTGTCGTMINNPGSFGGVTNLDVSHAIAQLEVTQCPAGFTVRKGVDGAPPGFSAQFTFLVQCSTPAGFYQKTVTVPWPTPGFIGINDIPPGSTCTVTEGPLPSALPAGYSWSGLPAYVPSGPIAIDTGAAVTVTNTLRECTQTGRVTVRKTLQGLPQDFSGTFAGTLQCWIQGTMTSHPITLTAPDSLTSVVPNIPLGSTCTFMETTQPQLAAGLQWNAPSYVPPFGTVTLDDACCKEIEVINQARTCCTVNGQTTCVVTAGGKTPP